MSSEASAFASPSETQAMRRALELALAGWGRVSPNPLVGAVVLQGDAVVGEGYHAEYGGPHAEVVALGAAGPAAAGATLVVSLEPCAHHGKTPPCTEAILAAGVARVVAAIRDPDPEARGGLDVLRRAGVDVALGLATSIDGRIADAAGRSQWVSGAEAREYVHWLRAGFDAIAVGGTTALKDNPQLTARGRVTPRQPPVRVVFDRRAMLNSGVTLVRTAREVPTWVVASREAPVQSVAALEQSGVRVFRPGSLADGLQELRAAGIQSLLCEGGGALGTKLLADGLVDRLHWIQSPVWLGDGAIAAFPGVPNVPLAEAPRWVPVERRTLGVDTLLVVDKRPCLPGS